MKNKIIFGKWEFVALLVNAMGTQIFLNFPRSMGEVGGTAGWIVAIYITLLALGGFYLITRLYKKFEGKDILDIAEHVGGGMGRVIVGVVLLAHLIFILSMILREFSEDMKVIALTVSPISFVSFFFIAGMITAAYVGIEAIVRLHSIVLPVIIIGFFIIMLCVSPYAKASSLLPILGNGPSDILGKGFFRISSFSALIILFVLAPFIKNHTNFKQVGYISIGITGIFMTASTMIYLSIMPYPLALENFLPMFELARIINLGRFFQRIESVFLFIWAISALLYMSTVFSLILYIFKKTFLLKHYKPLIIPFSILIFNISLLPPNLMTAVALETTVFRSWAWIVTFGLIIFLLLFGAFVNRKTARGGEHR